MMVLTKKYPPETRKIDNWIRGFKKIKQNSLISIRALKHCLAVSCLIAAMPFLYVATTSQWITHKKVVAIAGILLMVMFIFIYKFCKENININKYRLNILEKSSIIQILEKQKLAIINQYNKEEVKIDVEKNC